MSKLVGYNEGNMPQDIKKNTRMTNKNLVISIKDVKKTVKKNKYRNKYMALRQDKRPQRQIRITCRRRTTHARILKEL